MTVKEQIRFQILEGKLRMPTLPSVRKNVSDNTYRDVEAMFNALWNAYLLKGPGTTISTPNWAKILGSAKLINVVLKTLSVNGWIVSKALPNNNWGEAYLNEEKLLEYVDNNELAGVRKFNKFKKYLPSFSESTKSSITKSQGTLGKTGLNRPGFMKTGNTPYQFDTETMGYYRPEVATLINKGIDKMIEKYPQIVADLANYRAVGSEIVEALITTEGTYTGGNRTNDPRGRNNRGDLDKIGNPVGFKVMRSLLTIPKENRNVATPKGVNNAFLFIAELHGFKEGTKADKLAYGQDKYLRNALVDTKDLDKLYENIWLERVYADLDQILNLGGLGSVLRTRYLKLEATLEDIMPTLYKLNHYKWTTPIEIDMSASVLGYIGLLLNHKPFLERCNMIGDTLQDAWGHDVITNRDQFKTIMRQCYGSQLAPDKMWDDMDIEYTNEEVLAFNHELHYGELAVANAFKNFLIRESDPKPQMKLHVRNEEVAVKCNKYHNVGETTIQFDLYDTTTNRIRRIHHTDTKRIPDLKSFRRYFPTGLVHGLDGNVMDNTVDAVYDAYGWVIDIHDAMILCPEAADFARDDYAGELEDIHTNRDTILENYFRSIGVKASAIKKWKEEVLPLVEPLIGPFKCNPMVLK